MLCEMQSVSSRIGNRVAVSISYDDNHYTTGTSIYTCICVVYLTVCECVFVVSLLNYCYGWYATGVSVA